MLALNKAQIAEPMVESLGLNMAEAKEFVDLFFEEIRACLERGEEVKLSGFGDFELCDKRARPGRNPKTGELVPISARRIVTFDAGGKLRLRVASPDPSPN
ncbi:MAG: integration host factor subunit alpha [Xanthomonadaceae bacterium]|nr:integration host factor subunit alpha [Xanthomonadaceae bacterium]